MILLQRARVVLTQAVTWLVGLAVLVTLLRDQIATALPGETAEDVARWANTVVAWLGVAVAIIRRVTEVPADERGVLPAPTDT